MSSSRDIIDTVRVIEEVRVRKCLWDASDLMYKNKDARHKAWEDIVVALFGENISQVEKQQLGKQVQQRWKTARDAFFRTKTAMNNKPSGSGSKKYKKYVFYEELSFLNPSDVNEVDESQNDDYSISSPSENVASPENMVPVTSPPENPANMDDFNYDSSQRSWIQKRRKRLHQANQEHSQFERELLTLLSNQTPDIASDDLAFFFSLGPILKSFNFEQKLEFRSRVLRDAMDIKNMYYRPSTAVPHPRQPPRT